MVLMQSVVLTNHLSDSPTSKQVKFLRLQAAIECKLADPFDTS